jgi:hypothetical protein
MPSSRPVEWSYRSVSDRVLADFKPAYAAALMADP